MVQKRPPHLSNEEPKAGTKPLSTFLGSPIRQVQDTCPIFHQTGTLGHTCHPFRGAVGGGLSVRRPKTPISAGTVAGPPATCSAGTRQRSARANQTTRHAGRAVDCWKPKPPHDPRLEDHAFRVCPCFFHPPVVHCHCQGCMRGHTLVGRGRRHALARLAGAILAGSLTRAPPARRIARHPLPVRAHGVRARAAGRRRARGREVAAGVGAASSLGVAGGSPV